MSSFAERGRRLAALGVPLATCVALLAGIGSAAIGANCPNSTPPTVLPEPVFTIGETNVIRWERVANSCWDNEGANGKESTGRHFDVKVRSTWTGREEWYSFSGDGRTSATFTRAQLALVSDGRVDGEQYEFRVRREETVCTSGEPLTGACFGETYRVTAFTEPVRTRQDATRPTLELLSLAGGARFTRSLRIDVEASARDGGPRPSGVGFLQLSSTPAFECPADRRTLCVHEGLSTQFVLPTGPDGTRVVHARVFDRARGPSDGPGTTLFGRPTGNVSVPLVATITVDRAGPSVTLDFSSTRVQAGSAVTIDARSSRDFAGFGADSGLDPASGRWAFGDGSTASGLVATHAYAQPGTYNGTFTVADVIGNQTTAAFTIEVVAAPVAPTPGSSQTPPATTPETLDRTPPRLTSVAVRRPVARPSLAFRVSERATLAVEVVRISPRPVVRVAAFTRAVRAGRGQVALPRGAFRRPGRYRVRVVARDAARNVSAPRTLIVRRR